MNQEFEVHTLNELGKTKAAAVAEAFDECLTKLVPLVGDGRCLAIVKTKLEEASFFAKKGMAKTAGNTV